MSNLYLPTFYKLTEDQLAMAAVRGQYGENILPLSKYGKSASLSANIEEDVWTQGGALTYLASAETMNIVSTDVDDTASGTGARIVTIHGLDADYNLIQEDVILNGTTNVLTTKSYLRVYKLLAIDAGSSFHNEGIITATSSVSTTVQAEMDALVSTSEGTHFTIPAGYTGFQTDIHYSVFRAVGGSGAKTVEVRLCSRNPVAGTSRCVTQELYKLGLSTSGNSIVQEESIIPRVFQEKTDIFYRSVSETSGTIATVFYDMILVRGIFNTSDLI